MFEKYKGLFQEISIEEASRLLGIGQSWLRKNGDRLPLTVTMTKGGHRRYYRNEILELLKLKEQK